MINNDYPNPDDCKHNPITALESDDAPTGSKICANCGTMVEGA